MSERVTDAREEKSEIAVRFRVKVRALVLLPVIALAGVSLTACDSKAGTAAEFYGQKLSEKSLNNDVQRGALPISNSDGTQTAPKTLVIEVLIQNQAFLKLLALKHIVPTAAELDAARVTVLQGNTEQAFTAQVTKAGLQESFEKDLLYNQELSTIVTNAYGSDQASLAAGLKAIAPGVSINPRYGSWDSTKLALNGLGRAELPGVVTIDGPLPGDPTASATAAP